VTLASSSASVQRQVVSEEEISTLFWINILLGTVLALITPALAPAVAAFYHEPRLFQITIVLAAGFIFNAAGIQHSALLQREMRFTDLAGISVVSLMVSTTVAITSAMGGSGYWSLVAMSLVSSLVTTIGCWLATAWVPGMPRMVGAIQSMIRYGGSLTFINLLVYIGYNAEKVLIGRAWGPDAIGTYTRSYQLVNIPTDNLNSAVGEVAFSALSRVQDRSHSAQELLSEGTFPGFGIDPAHHNWVRSFC
jgi:PST family polysaccharide transporter